MDGKGERTGMDRLNGNILNGNINEWMDRWMEGRMNDGSIDRNMDP